MDRYREPRNHERKLRDLTQLFFIAGFFSCFLLAAYLQRGRFDQLFLFDAPDTPPVPGAFYPGPLGVHTFGDFLQPLWQSRLAPSPFITGYSSYMPAANGLFWILSWFPFWIAFGTLVVISLATLLVPFWMVDSEADYWARGQLLVGGGDTYISSSECIRQRKYSISYHWIDCAGNVFETSATMGVCRHMFRNRYWPKGLPSSLSIPFLEEKILEINFVRNWYSGDSNCDSIAVV